MIKILPFASDDTIAQYVNDAQIFISTVDAVFELIPSAGDSGYYHYPGDDLEIIIGEEYFIEFEFGVDRVEAETVVPEKPEGLSISEDIIEIAPIIEFQDLANFRDLSQIEVTWSNPDGDYYYVVVENLEDDPEPINTLDFDFGGARRNFMIVTEPVQVDFHVVLPFDLTIWHL